VGGPDGVGAIGFSGTASGSSGAEAGAVTFWKGVQSARGDAYPIAAIDNVSFRPPYDGAPITVGAVGRRWSEVWGIVHAGKHQDLTTGGAVSVNTQSGEMAVLTSNANVTGITLSAGKQAQMFTLEMVQGNASHTWPTTFTNARIAGGAFTKTATLNAVDTIHFRWNETNSTWDEVARTMALA